MIGKLCKLAGVKKSRTTPYHPMGNGMVERFNKTLLNMLGTLSDNQKSNWKDHVSTLTHAYNAADHESIGFSPFYLMFGRHPRLAIDAFLGIKSNEEEVKSRQDYSDKLKERLALAYEKAREASKTAGQKQKYYYDRKVRHVALKPGDRVLVRNVGLQGKQKLANIWDYHPYIIKSRPIPDIPVYSVQREHSHSKSKLLHRNMLLPFNFISEDDAPEESHRRRQIAEVSPESDSDDEPIWTDTSSSDDERQEREDATEPRQRADMNVTPQQRSSGRQISNAAEERAVEPPAERLRRPERRRQPPTWMRTGDWQVNHQPYIFWVNPSDVSYL